MEKEAEEGRHRGNCDVNTSFPTSENQIADPVIYKLVRVEGDGRLVPATDDEVMEVENMFEEEKVEIPSIAETLQVQGCLLNEESASVDAKAEDREGESQCENTKVDVEKLNARLEYIGVMLQKVKQEEKLRLSSSTLDHSSNHTIPDGQYSDQFGKSSAIKKKLQIEHSLQGPPLPSPRLKGSCISRSGSGEICLKPRDGQAVGESSASASCSFSMPDFSRIEGEICLDNLSIKELHETFRATFGRETTVKDKLWLKRRIAMGLTNSCDVSTETFIIKDNVLVGKKIKVAHAVMENNKYMIQINETGYDRCKDSPISHGNKIGDRQVLSCKRLRKPKAEYDFKSEVVCIDQSATKRVRKPTKRYIEELSDVVETRECAGRSISSIKSFGDSHFPSKSRVIPVCDVGTDEAALVTRLDSFGGSGVQVPYVSRVRRGRPRENFMSIMHYHPSAMGTEARLVKNTLGVSISRHDSDDRNWKDRGAPKHIQQQVVAKVEEGKENLVKCLDEQEQQQEQKQIVKLEHVNSFGDNTDCNMAFPISKDGFRRKHHRPWTLCEVVKLVEGVSKYGAGRWSEIKKVAFASYNYRTSVDLKDKWRNLLRASFAQGLNDKGIANSRKPGSMPLPAPILLRVRQLAEKHSQARPELSSVQLADCGGRGVHETKSGYL